MEMFVWHKICCVTDEYHAGGGLMIVTSDFDSARDWAKKTQAAATGTYPLIRCRLRRRILLREASVAATSGSRRSGSVCRMKKWLGSWCSPTRDVADAWRTSPQSKWPMARR